MGTMKYLATLACLLFAADGGLAENPSYRYSASVVFPSRAFLSPPRPQARLELELEARDKDYLAAPVLIVSFGGEAAAKEIGGACPRRDVEIRMQGGHLSGQWTAERRLDCGSGEASGDASGVGELGARWRVELLEGGVPVTPPGVEVSVKGAHGSLRAEDPPSLHAAGEFANFAIAVPGFRVDRIYWREDRTGIASHVLTADVAALGTAEQAARAREVEDSGAPPRNDRAESDPGATATQDPSSEPPPDPPRDSERSPPPAVRSLVFQLDPGRARWSRALAWLSPGEGAGWRAFELELETLFRRGELELELPGDLVGRDLRLQVMAFDGGTPSTVPLLGADGRRVGRLEIDGRGASSGRVSLVPPQPSWREVEVRVLDSGGAPVEGASVSVQVLDRRGHRIEASDRLSGRDGRSRHVLKRRDGREVVVFCAKPGWTPSVRRFGADRLPPTLGCRIAPASTPPAPDVERSAHLFSGRIFDAEGGRSVDGAQVLVQWGEREQPSEALVVGDVFALPAPVPAPTAAVIRVEAPCYHSFAGTVPLPLERAIALDYRCRRVGLSLRLLQAGTRTPVPGSTRARATVRQGGGIRASGISFDPAGFSEVREFLFDPQAGPVEVEVEAAGFERGRLEIDDLSRHLGESDIAGDFEISLRPAGRGLAVLLNAAERWPFYPRARDAVIDALRSSFPAEPVPDLLAFGLVSGSIRRLDSAALADEGALGRQLAWLQGLSATGGQLTPALLESRLRGFSDLWPAVSSWRVVLVIPHNELAANELLPGDEMHRLSGKLAERGVTLHVIEDGGEHPVYRDLTEALGGRHVALTAEDPLARAEELKTWLARIFSTQEEDPSDAR